MRFGVNGRNAVFMAEGSTSLHIESCCCETSPFSSFPSLPRKAQAACFCNIRACSTVAALTLPCGAGVYNPDEECEVGDLDGPEGMMKKCVADVCQPGNCLQCAGYVLYSSSTMLVLTIGTGVFGFTLDPLVGEFVLTHDNIKIPDVGEGQKIYSFNEGNYSLWDPSVQKYMDSLKDADKWGGKPYSVRRPRLPSLGALPMCAAARLQGVCTAGMLCAAAS